MNTTLKYGLMAAAAVIILHLILYFSGISETPTGEKIQWLNYLIYGGAIYLGLKEKLQKQEGYLSFGSAFGTGFLIILIAAVLVFGYRYAYYSTINPKVSVEMQQKVEDEMEKKSVEKNMDEAQREQARKISQVVVTPIGFAVTRLIGMILTGLILSLIFAAVMKNETPTFAQTSHTDDNLDPYK
jgi:chromosome condensin MukBEF ATPase and DNA-binding subunit MukB